MANIRKRNGKFQVQIRTAGRSVSKTFLRLNEARSWARETEAELCRQENPVGRYEPKTLAEILNAYLERETPKKADPASEAYIIGNLLHEAWVKKPIASLAKSDLTLYRERRLIEVKASTLRRQYGILRRACRVAQTEWDWSVPHALIASLSLPRAAKHVPGRISPADEARLLSADIERMEPLHLGMRGKLEEAVKEFALIGTGDRLKAFISDASDLIGVDLTYSENRVNEARSTRTIDLTDADIRAVLSKRITLDDWLYRLVHAG